MQTHKMHRIHAQHHFNGQQIYNILLSAVHLLAAHFTVLKQIKSSRSRSHDYHFFKR